MRHAISITFVVLLGGAAAIVSVAGAALYFPVIVLFGRDNPSQTLAGYLFAIAMPLIVLAIVFTSLIWSVRLLRQRRDTAAIVVAAIVCAAMFYAGVQLRPH